MRLTLKELAELLNILAQNAQLTDLPVKHITGVSVVHNVDTGESEIVLLGVVGPLLNDRS